MKWIYRHPTFYNFFDTVISFSLSDRVRRKVVSDIRARSFLEIGVGSGKNLEYANSEVRIGIDTSCEMLSMTGRRFPSTALICADAHRLPFRDASIEVSLFSYCLAVLARPADAMREALRVSRRVVVIDYYRPRLVPRLVWEKVITGFGRKVFGSNQLDFGSIAALAQRGQVRDFYQCLYRVLVLDGVSNA
jgi:ubiquinone/menaquinone biosynthesis C-methylase UbiE